MDRSFENSRVGELLSKILLVEHPDCKSDDDLIYYLTEQVVIDGPEAIIDCVRYACTCALCEYYRMNVGVMDAQKH